MKKGIVVTLVLVALIVLISPGIVGKLAEKSVDDNLEWAARENDDLVVSSENFDRGWFSSDGRHRVEFRDPGLQRTLLELIGRDAPNGFPALIIDTRLDHGLIPVASMGREKGTLAPGLGSAVSTMQLDYGDGEIVPLPGTIYSDIGLGGQTASHYIAAPGSHETSGASASWGDVDVELSTNRSSRTTVLDGMIDSVTIVADGDTLRLGKTTFASRQSPSKFDMAVGNIEFNIETLTVEEPGAHTVSMGPVAVDASAVVDGDRLNGDVTMSLVGIPVPGYNPMGLTIAMQYSGIDGAAIANLVRTLDGADDGASADELFLLLDADLRRIAAAGFELDIDHFDFDLPQGPVTSTIHLSVTQSDTDDFAWTSLLLDLSAEAELRVSAAFAEMAMATNPQAGAVIGMGFLRRNGDVYEMKAEYAKGLLTVNGAPMPIPLSQ